MKNSILLFSFFLLNSCRTETVDPERMKQFTISSTHTGRVYTITIQLPEDYSIVSTPYSAMYVLDAKQDDEFVGMKCNQISKELKVKNVVVVGIRYHGANDRNIDYTPTVTTYGQGAGSEFLFFIKNELIPAVQEAYNIDTVRTSRTIIGHSFGGLFGAYAFTKHNEIFGNYLLLSPSLFYDNSVILKYEQEKRDILKSKSQLVYFGAGSTENGLLLANNLLYERLKNNYLTTKLMFELVPGRGHVSSKNIGIENAIKFYFKNR